jgi:hypothetical protein
MDILVLLVVWTVGSIAAAFYAIRLNRTGAWGFVALVISPLLVFLLLLGLGPLDDDEDDEDDDRIPCPFCAEDIKAAAILCPYCRSDLTSNRRARL